MMSFTDLLSALEHSSVAIAIRQSAWLYPFLEIVHITGIVVLVGAAFMFDLRLLGFSKSLSIHALNHYLLPWSLRGLFFVVPSGLLLFSTNAVALAFDPVFWLKMILLLLAGLNAFVFHKVVSQTIARDELAPPPAAKLMAAASLLLWIAIIACGRLLAY